VWAFSQATGLSIPQFECRRDVLCTYAGRDVRRCWLLALSLALIAATVWLIRRRAA
jgi:hypothetical protein